MFIVFTNKSLLLTSILTFDVPATCVTKSHLGSQSQQPVTAITNPPKRSENIKNLVSDSMISLSQYSTTVTQYGR